MAAAVDLAQQASDTLNPQLLRVMEILRNFTVPGSSNAECIHRKAAHPQDVDVDLASASFETLVEEGVSQRDTLEALIGAANRDDWLLVDYCLGLLVKLDGDAVPEPNRLHRALKTLFNAGKPETLRTFISDYVLRRDCEFDSLGPILDKIANRYWDNSEREITFEIYCRTMPTAHIQQITETLGPGSEVAKPHKGVSTENEASISQASNLSLTVGVAWRGSFGDQPSKRNSFALEQLLPLLEVEGVHFVSLQDDINTDELIFFEQRRDIAIRKSAPIDLRNDPDGAATLLRELDLVISPSEALTRAASEMRVPTLLLAPWQRRVNATDADNRAPPEFSDPSGLHQWVLVGNKRAVIQQAWLHLRLLTRHF